MLRLRDLVFIVVGTVIGSGIFLVPGGVVRQTQGFAGAALLVWVVGGVLSLLGALSYAELGAMNPEAGGLYVYLRDAFGPATAFLYGWTFFLVINAGSAATLAVAAGAYVQELVAVGPVGQKVVALVLLAIVGAINVRGTRQSADVQNWTTAIKIAALVAMSLVLVIARPTAATTAISIVASRRPRARFACRAIRGRRSGSPWPPPRSSSIRSPPNQAARQSGSVS